jgi:hypothetical protein
MAYGQKTGGRSKGTPNKATVQRRDALLGALELAANGLDKPFEGNALAFMMSIYKNQNLDLMLRLEAAKVAIRFETAPMLSPLDPGGSDAVVRIVGGLPE